MVTSTDPQPYTLEMILSFDQLAVELKDSQVLILCSCVYTAQGACKPPRNMLQNVILVPH